MRLWQPHCSVHANAPLMLPLSARQIVNARFHLGYCQDSHCDTSGVSFHQQHINFTICFLALFNIILQFYQLTNPCTNVTKCQYPRADARASAQVQMPHIWRQCIRPRCCESD